MPVKINAVLLRGVNDDQAPELLRWCLDHGYELRFIEQMPLDAQHGWSREAMVTAEEIFGHLDREFVLTPVDEPRGSAPAELFHVDGGPATVGVIASVTRPFCGDCDRVRLTADGQVRNCLFAREESDLRGGPARRRLRRGARRALGGGDARQARRATASTTRRSSSPTARCRPSADSGDAHDADERATGPSRRRSDDVLAGTARAEEVAERGAVLVARQPGLAPVGRVQLRVVPEQRPDGGRRAAPGASRSARPAVRSIERRAPERRRASAVTACQRHAENERCRTTTGEAVRHLSAN